MARLTEYKGKALLREFGISTPRGAIAKNPAEVRQIAGDMNCPVVLKAQAFVTGRLSQGLVKFADSPTEAYDKSLQLFAKDIGRYQVEQVLVEERVDIAAEYFLSIFISDEKSQPVMMFSATGGTGIETSATENPEIVSYADIDIIEGLQAHQVIRLLTEAGIDSENRGQLVEILITLWQIARKYEARSIEVNPLIQSITGEYIAVDCRISIDDYAVFRHPELGIGIARELGRPPGKLDKIAYRIEASDYRGTFYFMLLDREENTDKPLVGFHGSGGGGSMMGMDALARFGLRPANFCDTSGNPPASKVYRAAMLILSQEGISGYFGTGSGVASQEQFHLARGLVKAFREKWLRIPAVMRLGGNGEDAAVRILEQYTADLPASVEGYKKDDTVEYCAERFKQLLGNHKTKTTEKPALPPLSDNLFSFATLTGEITFDHDQCLKCESKSCITACAVEILSLEKDKPVLNISKDDARKGKCIECLACELECYFHGNKGCRIDLPIEDL